MTQERHAMHSQRRRWEREKGVTQERHDMHSQRRRWEREKMGTITRNGRIPILS